MQSPASLTPVATQVSFDDLLFTPPEATGRPVAPAALPDEAPSPQKPTLPAITASPAPWTAESLREEVAKEEQGEKVTRADLARKKVDEGIASLAAALLRGDSAALTAYLTTMSRFYRYSFGNVLLIAFQNPGATHVAGFNTWKGMGRTVLKGEKGIMILAPLARRGKETEAGEGGSGGKEDQQCHTETKEKGSNKSSSGVWGFRVVYVFDISQTEGEELPQFAQVTGERGRHIDRLKTIIADEGIGLSYKDTLGGAFGLSRNGRVEVLSGLPPAREFSVLVHELAHELMHRERGQGETKTGRIESDATVRETEAEAVAYVVCQAIGLDTDGNKHADYIRLYRGSAETLSASLSRIQQTATRILCAVEDKGKQSGG